MESVMESGVVETGRVRRSESQWRELIEAWMKSGQSQEAFCRERGIALSSLGNCRRTQIKVLAFESGGYCVWSKRLEQGQFGTADQADEPMSPAQFLALLEGLDWRLVRRRKRYQKPEKSLASEACRWCNYAIESMG